MANRNRRRILTASLLAPALAGAATRERSPKGRATAAPLDLAQAANSLRAVVKLRGDLSGARVLQCYSGSLSLLVAGRAPARLASYQGVIRTDWTPLADGSFRYRTFDIGYFGDLATGEPVSTLTNPLTGESLVPQDIRDGPVEALYTAYGIYRDGATPDPSRKLQLSWHQSGDELWYDSFFPFQFPNPLPAEDFPELTSFPNVVQGSWFTYQGRLSDIQDPQTTRAPMQTILTVISTPHPWLRMGRMPALMLIQTVSRKIASIDDAPAAVRGYLANTMPDYLRADTPFVSVGNSFERYRRERAASATPRPVAPATATKVRRWRQYAASRYGQVHVWSAEPLVRARRLPLVCLHPSPTTGEMFHDLQTELASSRVVHCPDTPGFGASDAPPTQPGIADYGGALGDAFVSLGHGDSKSPRGQIDLFGFHTGSLIAVEFALQFPQLVRRLILAGVPHYDAARRPVERAAHVAPYPYFTDPNYVATIYKRLVLDAKDSGPPEARLRRFGDRLRAGPNGWWGPDAVFTYDSGSSLPKLKVPTLLIAFNEEMTEPTRAASRLIPGANLVEMLDLPIFGFIVAPARVAQTLRDFLDNGP